MLVPGRTVGLPERAAAATFRQQAAIETNLAARMTQAIKRGLRPGHLCDSISQATR